MFIQGTPFCWHGNQSESYGLSVFRSPVSGLYRLQRETQLSDRHSVVATISSHQTLEEAMAAANDHLNPC